MASFETDFWDSVPANQVSYFQRFFAYTDRRADAAHGRDIVRDQYHRGLKFVRQDSFAKQPASLTSFEARGMIGVSAAMEAIDAVCKGALHDGVSAICCSPIEHVGTLGFHLNEAANRGLVTIALLMTHPIMGTPDNTARIVGNNILSIGVPMAFDRNIVLDMSSSEGNVRSLLDDIRNGGTSYKSVDEFNSYAALKPFGGHKGAGLAIAVQLCLIALSGHPAPPPPTSLTDHCDNQLLIISLRPQESNFAAAMDCLAALKNSSSTLYVPGERTWI